MTAQVQSACEMYLKQQLAAAAVAATATGAKDKACKKVGKGIVWAVCVQWARKDQINRWQKYWHFATAALSGHTRGLSKYQQP